MWLLNWLPDWVFYAILLLGVITLAAGIVADKIPLISRYRIALLVPGVLLTVLGVWYAGGIAKDQEYRAQIAELQLALAKAEKESAESNARIEYVYRDRIRYVERNKDRAIQDIQNNATSLDANCSVPPMAIEILNRAAGAAK